MAITLLDGPMGTVLIEQGHLCDGPGWSAACIQDAPQAISANHAAYAVAGATHHTTTTFRTRPEAVGEAWKALATEAVKLARAAVCVEHRIMGGIAPIADCYRPDLSPPNPGPAHAALARVLVEAGVDLLLCETFPHVEEGLAAAAACLETRCETWLSFTAGPDCTLLSPDAVHVGAERAARLGVSAVLVNCIGATQVTPYLDALSGLGLRFGVYANAGTRDSGVGWDTSDPDGPERYADLAEGWIAQGATLIGGCCGTDPRHIAALRTRLYG